MHERVKGDRNFVCLMYGGGRKSEGNVNNCVTKSIFSEVERLAVACYALLECFDTVYATSKLPIQDLAPMPCA